MPLSSNKLQIHELRGRQIVPWLESLGTLRIGVFREYPYLYDGTMEYELRYLSRYAECERSLLVLVTDAANQPVGASTCMPLLDETGEFQQPFLSRGDETGRILYLGESVVLPQYRGFGLGKRFFQAREQHARDLGLDHTAFCAVDRDGDDPRKPDDYRSPESLWKSLGYEKQSDLKATFSWKEIGETMDHPKSLTFWMKSCPP